MGGEHQQDVVHIADSSSMGMSVLLGLIRYLRLFLVFLFILLLLFEALKGNSLPSFLLSFGWFAFRC